MQLYKRKSISPHSSQVTFNTQIVFKISNGILDNHGNYEEAWHIYRSKIQGIRIWIEDKLAGFCPNKKINITE